MEPWTPPARLVLRVRACRRHPLTSSAPSCGAAPPRALGLSCYSPPTNADPGQDLARSTPLRPRHRQDHCCISTPRCCSLHVKTVSVGLRQVPLPLSTSSQDQVPLRTNVNNCRRKNGTGKSEDLKYHDTDDMNIYGMYDFTALRQVPRWPEPSDPSSSSMNREQLSSPKNRVTKPSSSTMTHVRLRGIPRTPSSMMHQVPRSDPEHLWKLVL
ncbi:hypothetical protein TRIUR3_23421 [Triticum urartu]|uniref:Uncharacterized protein n=1 Tax=Triticum urartu TaxID=4572 RepID=M7YE30_TRIUA|nr:hypothetical protein TRIUR3_23421 [Triticum urartu]